VTFFSFDLWQYHSFLKRLRDLLCWYSQLRDLLNEHPKLAAHLRIRALPGRGFRGDWFIGVAEGSVSVNLGLEVLEILTTEKEEYKRFVRGVGLPTRRKFYKKTGDGKNPDLLIWPHGINAYLHDAYEIHHQAFSRRYIKDYNKFRQVLTAICRGLAETPRQYTPEEISTLVKRIPGQIRLLTEK